MNISSNLLEYVWSIRFVIILEYVWSIEHRVVWEMAELNSILNHELTTYIVNIITYNKFVYYYL